MKQYTFTLTTKILTILALVVFLIGQLPVLLVGTEYMPLFKILLWVVAGFVIAAIYIHKRLGGKIDITIE